MTEEELQVEQGALKFIKANSKMLIEKFASASIYKPAEKPVSLFMAGSPGAGKTEVSKSLIKKFRSMPIRIDADEIRQMCPGYIGANAHLFQKAANKGVNILLDYALHHDLNLILDGTFAYGGAKDNIQRSIDHGRLAEIWFIYQDPVKAWEFTKVRELREARHVSKEVFVRAFFESKKNAASVKNLFKNKVELNILIKDYEDNKEEFRLNIEADQLDHYLHCSYTEADLDTLLK